MPNSVVTAVLGINEDVASTIIKNLFDGRTCESGEELLQTLRRLPRDKLAAELKKLPKTKLGNSSSREVLDSLYAIPFVVAVATEMLHTVEKETGKSVGTLRLKLEIDWNAEGSGSREVELATFVVVLGTKQRRMFLAQTEFSISASSRKTSIEKAISFDWNVANADGGEGGGFINLRILQDRYLGMDSTMQVRLR